MPHVAVVIDNAPLECTDTFKYLGVTINKTMTWGDHVEATSTKINQWFAETNMLFTAT